MKLAYWKFYLFVAAVVGSIAGVFWSEFGELASTGYRSLVGDDAAHYQLRDSDLDNIRSVSFERLRNNANLLTVKSVSIVGREGSSVRLAVFLQSRSTDNSLPWLNVAVKGQGGERSLNFSPAAYTHGDKLSNDPISVLVPIQPGERTFTVRPFYKEGAQ